MSAQLRDRLTGEMHAILTRSLHSLGEAMNSLPADSRIRGRWSGPPRLTTEILEFAAAVAGLAAENMVRGGGRLFLDFGRRMERAQAIAGGARPGAGSAAGRCRSPAVSRPGCGWRWSCGIP